MSYKYPPPVPNQSYMATTSAPNFLTRNAALHRCSQHIDVRYHYIREQYEQGRFELEFVSGKENPADLFTKALPGDRLSYLCSYFFT